MSSNGPRGRAVEKTGTAGLRRTRRGRAPRGTRAPRRLIAGEWKAPATGELHRLHAVGLAPRSAAAREPRSRAGEDELAGGVVVGEREPELARDQRRLALVAEHARASRRAPRLGGLLHQPAALGREPQRRRRRRRRRPPPGAAARPASARPGRSASGRPAPLPGGEAGAVGWPAARRRCPPRSARRDRRRTPRSRSSSSSGRALGTSSRMPGVWLPWPGKIRATPVAAGPAGRRRRGVESVRSRLGGHATDSSPDRRPG